MTIVQETEPEHVRPTATPRPRLSKKAQHSRPENTDSRSGMFIRLATEDKERAKYWSEKRGFSSVNEYVAEAVEEKIRRENLDYDLPTLEIARLNELIDQIKALSTNQANLERALTLGFDSLIGMTRGDNYLLEDESGEL